MKANQTKTEAPHLLQTDPWLAPYATQLAQRVSHYTQAKQRLLGEAKSLRDFANGHKFYGFHQEGKSWVYREWAPAAEKMALVGDFNGWDADATPMEKVSAEVWQATVPGKLPHKAKVRVLVWHGGERLERVPLYATRAVQNPETFGFDGQIWAPEKPYKWKNKHTLPNTHKQPLLVYECHVGMSDEEGRVADYLHFAKNVLPRIKRLGYNAIQLMAVMEHPYYASFGYQVSGFYSASSRFGTPDELKQLVDAAHGMGISVILDIVHSHAAANEVEGPSRFDGTPYQLFHGGQRGFHPAWGSRVFDYGKPGVQHFLLSNLKFWLEEYCFDGFRFDGVTSMLYNDHGLGRAFTGYRDYFTPNTDLDAVSYLTMACELCHETLPGCVVIAEEMSGMPGLCRPIEEGGMGFDYRLAMGVPDFWDKTLAMRDEAWDTGSMWHELSQRRPGEKVIGYCESHDQALVGSKTIMFRLADAEMYWHMEKGDESPVIQRALKLHKMIRLVTFAAAGEGYLNFMGNEFGHPEWIDFPREDNGGSYNYARRQWSLADNKGLYYHNLEAFDMAMLALVKDMNIMASLPQLHMHDANAKVLVFGRGPYIFAFNFHPTKAYNGKLNTPGEGGWRRVLHTEWAQFAGPMRKSTPRLVPHGGRVPLELGPREAMVLCWEA